MSHRPCIGDYDVTLSTEEAKEKAMEANKPEEIRIQQRHYLPQIPGVPLSLEVASRVQADNNSIKLEVYLMLQLSTVRQARRGHTLWQNGPIQRLSALPETCLRSLLQSFAAPSAKCWTLSCCPPSAGPWSPLRRLCWS